MRFLFPGSMNLCTDKCVASWKRSGWEGIWSRKDPRPPSTLGPVIFGRNDLAAAIGSAVGASMVRKPGLSALWASNQLGQVQMMMCAAITLAGVRRTLFR